MQTSTIIFTENTYISTHGLESFYQARAAFKQHANTTGLQSWEHVCYNLLRGKPLNRGFTAITNSNKLNNGVDAIQGFNAAKATAKHFLKTQEDTIRKRFNLAPEWTATNWLFELNR